MDTSGSAIELLATLSVERVDRAQCQCEGCGHVIYQEIHMVRIGERIECWGSTCFRTFFEVRGLPIPDPTFVHVGCRRLTEEERRQLRSNRERLVEAFLLEESRRSAERSAEAALRKQSEVAKKPKIEERPPVHSPHLRISAELREHHLKHRSAEPLDDLWYRDARAIVAEQWRANGLDPESVGQIRSFVENVKRLAGLRRAAAARRR